jgi:8-oxo-dGTP diphosphatase
MDEQRFYFAVKAVIFYRDSVLLIKRTDRARGHHRLWEFPGGRLEFGESPHAAIEREVFEETGLSVRNLGLLSTWSFMKNPVTQLLGVTFLCVTQSDAVRLSEEHDEAVWVTPDQVLSFEMFEELREDIKRWDWDEIMERVRESR